MSKPSEQEKPTERQQQAIHGMMWLMAAWKTPGVGIGYQDLVNVYEILTGTRGGL